MSENTLPISQKSYLLTDDFCRAGHDIREKDTALIKSKRYGNVRLGTYSYKCRECFNTIVRERVRAKGAKPQKHFLEPNSDLGKLANLIRHNPKLIKHLTEIAKEYLND